MHVDRKGNETYLIKSFLVCIILSKMTNICTWFD
jgi:hypothetical protein